MTEEWKKEKKYKKARMIAMQALPYEVKIKRAELRAREYVEKLDDMGLSAHVSVGGLDSIVLLLFLRSIGINIPAISVSALEDRSIQRVHKELGVIPLAPGKPKVQILQEYGFPVISKKIAGRIDTLQHPTEKNKTVRHAIITGECGAQGHYAKNSRMKLPQKWLELFAGYENENEGVDYRIAPFLVSNKCCLYMKELPCERWAKEHNSRPFLGLMASEGGAKRRSPDRTWMQLFWERNDPERTVRAVFKTGFIAACLGLESPSTGDIWNDCPQARRNFVYHRGTAHRMQYVRVWRSYGATSSSVRSTPTTEPERMGVLDVPMLHGSGDRRKIWMGPSSGLYRSPLGRLPVSTVKHV